MEDNYCLYHRGSQILFGLLLGQQKSKAMVLPQQGRQFNAPQNQLLLSWQAGSYATPEEGLEKLNQQVIACEKKSHEIDCETIHQLVEPGQNYDLGELAELFLDDPKNGWDQVSLLLALKGESIKFHNKKTHFTARTPEEMEQLIYEEQKKREAYQKKEREEAWLDCLKNNQPLTDLVEHAEHGEQFRKRLHHFALHWEQDLERQHFADALGLDFRGPRSAENRMLEILGQLGISRSWGQLQVERAGVAFEFSEANLQAAEELTLDDPAINAWGLENKDLTQLDCITIDNAETKDYDDALSGAPEGENFRLYVHIANVAAKLLPHDPLFTLAQDRVSSLYSPLAVYPMLPPALGEEYFSLKAGSPKAALTFESLIDPIGEVLEWDFYPSLIQVDENLTYEKMDEILTQEQSPWVKFSQTTQALASQRAKAGALEISRRELQLDLSDRDQIQIQGYRMDTPASLMVQETAILANRLAAEYCTTHQLPSLFRNQPPYELNRELAEGEKPTLKDIRIQPAKLGVEAIGHAALGLKSYQQVTSPIRRFLDLMAQSILQAHKAGKPTPFTSEELMGWAIEIEEKSRSFGQTERLLWDHWKIKFIAQNPEMEFTGLVQRRLRNGRWLVRLEELEMPVEMDLSSDLNPIQVQVRQVRPDEDWLDLVETQPSPPEV